MAARTPVGSPTPGQIYTALTTFLHRLSVSPLPPQLEILPPALIPSTPLNTASSTWPLLITPPNLGISKRALIQAVVVARNIFFDSPNVVEEPSQELRRKKLEAATVLLVFDPEHVTAVNYHREYFNQSLLHGGHTDLLTWGIGAEMLVLEGLLTSPGLDKHTKSPTLWAYRRWLVRNFGVHRPRRPSMVAGEVKSGDDSVLGWQQKFINIMKDIHHELGIVKKAGGIHARNYHAWQYARFILTHLLPPLPPTSTLEPTTMDSNSKAYRSRSLYDLTNTHFTHSLLHPTDTSIWSFLLFLLTTYPEETSALAVPILSQTISALSELEPPLRGVVPRFIREGERGGREAMWNFVRTVIGGGEGGMGLCQILVARAGLLRQIEQTALKGARFRAAQAAGAKQEQHQDAKDDISVKISAEDQMELARRDSPPLIALDPEAPKKPGYLNEERFAWRAYAWIGRRAKD